MKTAAIAILLVCFAANVFAQVSDAGLPGDDSRRQLIRDVASLSQAGDYAKIYEFLGSDYRRRVTKEVFVRGSKDAEWILSKPRIGTIQSGTRSAYCPVQGTVRTAARNFDINAVVFFVKEEKGWRLQNFPFLPEHMPNWPEVPEWLE